MHASAESDIEAAFSTLVEQGTGAVLIAADNFLRTQTNQIVELAVRHQLPVLCAWRECAIAGGLMSYGASAEESFRQEGIYVGRILGA
jgi:putative ABC transport system substrate-binding protein